MSDKKLTVKIIKSKRDVWYYGEEGNVYDVWDFGTGFYYYYLCNPEYRNRISFSSLEKSDCIVINSFMSEINKILEIEDAVM